MNKEPANDIASNSTDNPYQTLADRTECLIGTPEWRRKAMKSKTTGWMAALSFCLAAEAMACSAFVLHKGDECVMGFNENWGGEAPGFVLLNQPGRAKRGVTDAEWTGGAALSAEPAIRWTSRYGSLTFNCFGKDSPSFGVNEKGLMVAELGCGYPAKPSPPLFGERPLAMAAWVQYVLDRFSGVDEALEDIAASRLAVQCGTHQFFLADSSGRAGAIMFDCAGRSAAFQRSGAAASTAVQWLSRSGRVRVGTLSGLWRNTGHGDVPVLRIAGLEKSLR